MREGVSDKVWAYNLLKSMSQCFPKALVTFCCHYQIQPLVNAQLYCHPGGGRDIGTLQLRLKVLKNTR